MTRIMEDRIEIPECCDERFSGIREKMTYIFKADRGIGGNCKEITPWDGVRSMRYLLAMNAVYKCETDFLLRPNLAKWRKLREAERIMEVLVDAQKRCAEMVNNASRFRVKKGKKQK